MQRRPAAAEFPPVPRTLLRAGREVAIVAALTPKALPMALLLLRAEISLSISATCGCPGDHGPFLFSKRALLYLNYTIKNKGL